MSPLACLLLLLVIAFFGVFSFKGLSGWWGYPLAISGLIGLGISLMVTPVVSFFTNSFLKDREFSGLSPILVETGSDLVVGILRSLFLQVRNYSLVVIGMGLAVIITAAIIKVPPKKDPGANDNLEENQDVISIPDPDAGENPKEEKEDELPDEPEVDQDDQEKDDLEDPVKDETGSNVE